MTPIIRDFFGRVKTDNEEKTAARRGVVRVTRRGEKRELAVNAMETPGCKRFTGGGARLGRAHIFMVFILAKWVVLAVPESRALPDMVTTNYFRCRECQTTFAARWGQRALPSWASRRRRFGSLSSNLGSTESPPTKSAGLRLAWQRSFLKLDLGAGCPKHFTGSKLKAGWTANVQPRRIKWGHEIKSSLE